MKFMVPTRMKIKLYISNKFDKILKEIEKGGRKASISDIGSGGVLKNRDTLLTSIVSNNS